MIWRVAWAFDTINDYFPIFPDQATTATVQGDTQPLYQAISSKYFNALGGAWWDDYGWAAIAALRAAESGLYDETAYTDFVQFAINAFCYMYGPGWRTDGGPAQQPFTVPFMGLAGWTELMTNNNNTNIGAPNVYVQAPGDVNAPGLKSDLRPMLRSGGIWNSPMSTTCHPTTGSQSGTSTNLCGIQNTVTNGLYTVLALRLCKAYNNPTFRPIFTDADVDPAVIFSFWVDQMTWFDQWFDNPTSDASMKYDLGTFGTYGALVRERAPMLGSGLWDSSYYPKWVWTGDQGILLGAASDLEQARSNPGQWIGNLGTLPALNFLSTAGIMAGVYNSLYGPEATPSGDPSTGSSTLFLHPWALVTVNGSNPPTSDFTQPFMEGDDADYRTGCAVFYRYLGQAIAAGQSISNTYADQIAAAATLVMNMSDDQGTAPCDCYYYDPYEDGEGSGCSVLTHWINRLAVLCLAIQIAQLEVQQHGPAVGNPA